MLVLAPELEARRIQSVRALHMLDTARESVFDQLTQLVAELCQTPMAALGLVDGERVWFKATYGLYGWREVSRWSSLCSHAVLTGTLVGASDATQDPRCCTDELVCQEPHVRFYASAPLIDQHGLPLGTLSVMDSNVRPLNDKQRATLTRLAAHAVDLMMDRPEHRPQVPVPGWLI